MSDSVRLILRLLGLAVGILIGWQFGALLASGDPSTTGASILSIVLAIGALGYLLGPRVVRSGFLNLRSAIREASPLELVAVVAGLVLGGLIAALLAYPLSLLPDPLGQVLPIVVMLVAVALAISVFWARKRDLIAPWFRFVNRPEPQPVASAPAPPDPVVTEPPGILLDTSIIIDGRIADVLRTGFLAGRLLVPQFVLEELQRIADSSDPLRRQRGRRGLDSLNRLQADPGQAVEVVAEDDMPTGKDVDGLLVRVALDRGLRILTNDYNLERVAQIQGVTVLNLNELTSALRPPVLPGEDLQLKVVQEGREPGQGVGFLDDGTMVVVDGGEGLVGEDATVTVTRLLPTGAGRMVFAVPKGMAPTGGGTGELRGRPGGTGELRPPRRQRQTGELGRPHERQTGELRRAAAPRPVGSLPEHDHAG